MNFSSILSQQIPSEYLTVLRRVADLVDERKQGAVIVGGVVRDLMLKRPVIDLDVMLDHPAQPVVEKLAQAHRATVVSHAPFYTFNVTFPSGKKIDFVTAREEMYPKPVALPVVSPSTIDKDFKRRDFTINAMAVWINKARWGELLDPYFGQADMEKKHLRALHNKSFEDDPTRIFRAARFSRRLGFQIEPETEAWILKSIRDGKPALLSPVRRRHEFELILKEKDPLPPLNQLEAWDALRFLHPDWKKVPPSFRVQERAQDKESMLTERLVQWFGQWDVSVSKKMMADLQFEKAIKTKVARFLSDGRSIV